MGNILLAVIFAFLLGTIGTAIWVIYELVTYLANGNPFYWWSLLAFGIFVIITLALMMASVSSEDPKLRNLPQHQDRKYG